MQQKHTQKPEIWSFTVIYNKVVVIYYKTLNIFQHYYNKIKCSRKLRKLIFGPPC